LILIPVTVILALRARRRKKAGTADPAETAGAQE
jgi:hypothetical protein